MDNFGFDWGLAGKITVHLIDGGWSIYDSIRMANYESGGIPKTGEGLNKYVNMVSNMTGKSKTQVKDGVENAYYNPPSQELLAQYLKAVQWQTQQQSNQFSLASMPTWGWVAIIGGLGALLLWKK